jgi:hypothetical protein
MLFGKIPFLSIKGERAAFLTVERPLVITSITVNILVSSLLISYLFILLSVHKRRIRRFRKRLKKGN